MNITSLNTGLDLAHPWALTRYPGQPWRLAHALGTGDAFVIQPYQRGAAPVHLRELDALPEATTPLPNFALEASPDKATHLQRVRAAVNAMPVAYQKVVLSRTVKHDLGSALRLGDLLMALETTYPTAYVFAVHLPGSPVWVGASPERLLKLHGGTGETISLAGTRTAAELRTSPWTSKEVEEQALVTDYLRARLAEAGAVITQTTGPEDHRAGHLTHRRTALRFATATGALPLAQILHPTPAVCGLPQAEAAAWIAAHETHDRGLYTGFMGWVPNNAPAELFVMLRCMQLSASAALLYVGGGLTKDSDPEAEWTETEAKAETLLSVLRMY